jgi:hypothetical protein
MSIVILESIASSARNRASRDGQIGQFLHVLRVRDVDRI